MYISTYIRNKNFHQHSYGFQNLMSSLGWGNIIFEITIFKWVFKFLVPKVEGYQWQIDVKFGVESKFSNLQQVGDFSIFGSKSLFSGVVRGKKIEFWWVDFNVRLGTYNVPSGSSATSLTIEREGRVWWDGLDDHQKCPSMLFILCEHLEHVYIYLYTK